MASHELSIVIPVLNDTEALRRLLATISSDPQVDIVVVNGGAADDQLTAICRRPDVRLLTSAPGRACQMNAGASAAAGRWIVFLHADTRLPLEWSDEIRRASADPAVVGGSFRFTLDSTAWQARLIERVVERRVRRLDLAYGDQALFVRRDVFDTIGGYPDWPLMEDVAFVRRLHRAGKLYHSPQPVLTSARRWERDGWWRRSAKNVMLQALFFAGVAPERLAQWYSHPAPRSTRAALVVMARVPSDSRGKSRLIRDLGGDHVELRRALLQDTLDAVRGVPDVNLFVAFEPSDSIAEMRELVGDGARLIPQHGETLGDRMCNAFADVFAAGYSPVVLIGSDLPSLPSSHLTQAFDRLRDGLDAVIGPAVDGGYYLIGLCRPCPALFASMAWSTPDVLATTMSTAQRCGLTVSLLFPWHDVDTVDDLRRVLRDAQGATRIRAWMAAHGEIGCVSRRS